MTECGTVVERQGDGRVLVEVARGTACDGCHATGACNLGFGQRTTRVLAHDATGAVVGQRVTLELADGAFLAACAWVYLVPLAGLFLGAGLAYGALGGVGSQALREGLSALAALAGTAAGLGLVWRHDKKVRDVRGGPSGRFEVRVRAEE
jgi:sigma-E factor negative regulatory protein RseC